MSVDPEPWPSADPASARRTSGLPPTTGDEGVDQILADFARVGAESPHAQVEAAETAYRRLQARLSSP